MGILSGGCGDAVWVFAEAVWRASGCYLEGVVRLSGGVGRLSGGCGDAVWKV